MLDITVGLRAPHDMSGRAAGLRDFVARVEATGIDRLCVGDHVTFKGGRGFDGLLTATALAALSHRLTVQTSVYLLPLRHPVPVARQLATLAELAPGRLMFGVGLGGEDPAELHACGVDPATRGARFDEALAVLRALAHGAEVTMSGRFFSLDQVSIRPAPDPPVPIVVGGRSDAALRRVARHGDGWLGLWVSPTRYADAVQRISTYASDAGRDVPRWSNGMHVWCGIGTEQAAAQQRLGTVMEEFYQVAFSKFERYCPCGTPGQIAESLQPYVAAGCRSFNLIPVADSEQAAIEGADAVRTALRVAPAGSSPPRPALRGAGR